MRRTVLLLATAIMAGTTIHAAAAQSRAEQIRERLDDANRWRGHVMVVAHRTGWKENGRTRFAEDSVAAIRHSVALGAEMVELDVRKSADGALVIVHDSWLNRTTTCTGEVAKTTLAELKRCHLVIEDTGEVTDETVPTLKDVLRAAKDDILVNIDNKLGPEILPEIAREAREIGVSRQIVMKANLWNQERIDRFKRLMARMDGGIVFMPIFADDAVGDAGFIRHATKAFSAPAAELIDWHADDEPVTRDGGALFSAKVRAAAIAGNWHIWADTYAIVNKPDGMLSGGRGDAMALAEGNGDAVYGFWVDRGATMIQTDEPKAAIAWLEKHGRRIPYDDEAPVLATRQ
ncbi:glycerophosphodiester phosphodiesterase family protein [Pararhizobium mangrovi]|uniref:Glycerophosphodiester phosphodiesterase family protein n=1 Tax=Pararhizobium mangrovi TaxID=2590452 RepID=A0A506TUX7_9HYPH|nr:glycerophosphodiester phosphodiesterase family protein [Pararhizobium mangrovi]TPW25873.1 glycerophosphodiester phosphodiesterase family protein [Pararhizobium mangrovi]